MHCSSRPSALLLCFFFLLSRPPPQSTLFPYTTLFRSIDSACGRDVGKRDRGRLCVNSDKERQDKNNEQSRVSCFRSEEHTSELQSLRHLVCRLLLEK